ncbi:MAG: AAA family ATPase [Thermomicrobiales bacterium]|nr:AAA family ATPase [Thermomicrobiales bacterium]
MPEPANDRPCPRDLRQLPVVGRTQERTLLQEQLALACAGSGGLVLLAGVAGIGKTTLLADLGNAAAARGALVATGHCFEAGSTPAFSPWLGVLAALPGHHTLPPPFGSGPAAGSAHHLLGSVATYLRRLAQEHPVVILLDDVHWADRDTLELLTVVAGLASSEAILLAGAYRSETVTRDAPFFALLPELRRKPQSWFITIGRLDQEAAAELVEARHGPCSPALATYLHTRAGGHPLFLVEILRDLSERRVLTTDAAGRLLPPEQEEKLPSLLVHVITHRVARLGSDAETLLEVAAVAGESWRLDTIEAVLGWDEDRLLAALVAALQAEIIVPEGAEEHYRFSHGLIRRVLYDLPVVRHRRRLHRRIAEALEAAPDVGSDRSAALAYHFGAAGIWQAAARYGLAAGDAARERFAGHGALEAYQRADAAVSQLPVEAAATLRVDVLERLGRTHLLLGSAAQAESDFQQMRDMAQTQQDHPAAGRALIWLSYAQRRQYHPHASLTSGEAGLRVAEELADPALLALAHWNLGHFHEVYGPLAESDEHARAAIELALRAQDADIVSRSLQIRSILEVWQGQYAVAAEHAQESLRLAPQGHDGLTFVGAHWRLGLALGESGRYSEALRVLRRGMENAAEIGERYYLSKLLNTLGWLHLEVGAADMAREWDLRALETVRSSKLDRVTEAERYTLLNLASDELAAGRVLAAAAYLHEFAPLRDQSDYGRYRYLNRAQLVQADLALAQGDAVSALNAATTAGRLASEMAMRKNLARSHLLTGRALLALRRPREALATLRDGVALADDLGHGRLRWQGRLWLGQGLAATHQDATLTLLEARQILEELGRAIDEDALRAALWASPEAVALQEALAVSPAHAVERPAGLTAREVDVLRLLMDHHTDREIAAALYLSHRTVGSHVASILSKLGVANRREAIAAATALQLG